MPAEILWINHAGYELRARNLRIVHDPWLSGLAFGDAWALISESRYKPADFAGVDYIWFSHEHPDHFSPAVLKAIPEDVRRTITVLFQQSRDQRVANFCRKLGFAVRELPDRERVALNDQVAVTCGQVLGRDSWLFTETPDGTIFNANDCVGVDWTAVAASLPKAVDTLLTQFSYANWVGNPGDHETMQQHAANKFVEIRRQVAAFTPKRVIPFASFVWFCRDDNFFMNEHANRIEDVAATLAQEIETIVLYPGDTFVPGTAHDNGPAIARYRADAARRVAPIQVDEPSVGMTELRTLSDAEQARLQGANKLWTLRPLAWIGQMPPVTVYLRDLGLGVRYSMFGGILASDLGESECEMTCTSSSFALAIKTGFGVGTLQIGGRYTERVPGAATRLGRHFAVAARNEEGLSVPGVFLQRDYVVHQIKARLPFGKAA